MKVNWDDDIPNISGKIIQSCSVRHHQPVYLYIYILSHISSRYYPYIVHILSYIDIFIPYILQIYIYIYTYSPISIYIYITTHEVSISSSRAPSNTRCRLGSGEWSPSPSRRAGQLPNALEIWAAQPLLNMRTMGKITILNGKITILILIAAWTIFNGKSQLWTSY